MTVYMDTVISNTSQRATSLVEQSLGKMVNRTPILPFKHAEESVNLEEKEGGRV